VGGLVRATDSQGQSWTHYYRREDTYSRFDYILVSPGLKSLVTAGRARIWDGAGANEASDHRAVYLDLRVTPAR
jgi:endonuclease/exonuclease/phosphatase family metal-dependent hydrolase